MWASGITQGLMWSAINADGTLTYSFVESLQASKPFYLMRFFGGVLVVAGMLIMAYNVFRTIKGHSLKEPEFQPDAQAA
jgi:cytochrome c oxidase cbb3-type subunit 1